ncbi:amidohydrolase family protein [Desulfopila inferna]|uniref:amidohydrolase family protein n=1 Tax=Desulfopila inferna TaxID=468528 RepID=UPI0019649A81|nr:amidohydrolase family protein [Desulfopila inferna]MBM9603092.1 amidohydrolase family protein [Desulfopila inferna]
MPSPLVYTAPLILPIGSDIIRNGAIVVDSEGILDIGSSAVIAAAWKDCETVALSGVVIPPLINCHIHLELSHVTGMKQPPPDGSMVDWIEALLADRQLEYDDKVISRAKRDMIESQKRAGVVLMADIGNLPVDRHPPDSSLPEIYSIVEVLAPTRQRTSEILQQISALPERQAVSPHAPYSTSADLLIALKNRAGANKQIFTIHLAETGDEKTLLSLKSGPFRKFLEKRESWDNTLLPSGDFSGSVDYLDKLGVLDEKTLCVHCVHVNDEEIGMLAKHGTKVCLCPGSNRFLRTGPAPLEKMLATGILPGIGTDSRASNEDPNMWGEMRILHAHHPKVSPSVLLAMATLGGARALHRESDYGTLEKGKKPVFLEIEMDNLPEITGSTEREIFEELIYGNGFRNINWIHPFEKI